MLSNGKILCDGNFCVGLGALVVGCFFDSFLRNGLQQDFGSFMALGCPDMADLVDIFDNSLGHNGSRAGSMLPQVIVLSLPPLPPMR
jgi:hypothetical protein